MSSTKNKLRAAVLQDSNWHSEHGCGECPISEYCLPLGLSCADSESLGRLMQVSRPLECGQPLIHAGDPLRALYAVRAGCFKTTAVDLDGNERVVDFHLPSELIGLDAIFTGVHPSDVTAVTMGKLCIFPYRALLNLAGQTPGLLDSLLKLFSKNLLAQLAHTVDNTADQRLAGFLLRLSLRLPRRGEINDRFLLPMSRTDIASHLRVATGTLSRMIASLQDRDLVRVEDRLVEIIDVEGLQASAGPLAEIIL